ncbi:follistatin-A-like [Rhipicephalus sanguineus]|uniref:follistatin-A-like n=1 Tax=Rhipicephalus sanguineus TaxID=34632 RepID=UPI0020C1F1F3|nr:follistatin-A-like [Rhipicephalus sanguineus]
MGTGWEEEVLQGSGRKALPPVGCDPCRGVQCPASQVCQLDEQRNPICRCNGACPGDLRPVCGSDGRTYPNECLLRVEACRSRRPLRLVYAGACSQGLNPCGDLQCQFECSIDRFGKASCTCPPPCEQVLRPVCGSDGKTYDSACHLRREACLAGDTELRISYAGPCDAAAPCHGFRCPLGAFCSHDGQPSCHCPPCSEEFEPVCGSDGISYPNECKLRRETCQRSTAPGGSALPPVAVAHPGLCSDPCDGRQCPFYGVCEAGELSSFSGVSQISAHDEMFFVVLSGMAEASTVVAARSPAISTDVSNLTTPKTKWWAARDQDEALHSTDIKNVGNVANTDSIGKGQNNITV